MTVPYTEDRRLRDRALESLGIWPLRYRYARLYPEMHFHDLYQEASLMPDADARWRPRAMVHADLYGDA